MLNGLCNFQLTRNEIGEYSSSFNPVTRPVMSWHDEILYTARYIRSMTDKPLYVCMSGGIDSELVAVAFLKQKIPFRAITLNHMQYTNDHELSYVINWCTKNDVPLDYLPLDLTDFFVRGIDEYIKQGYIGGTNTYSVYTWLYLLEAIHAIGGVAVMGMGESVFRNVGDVTGMEFIPYRYTLVQYLQRNPDQIHFPWFFLTTPELLASYLQEPIVKMLTDDPLYHASPFPHDIQSLEKAIVYHKHFPQMYRRGKGTGWERIRAGESREQFRFLQRWIKQRADKYREDKMMKLADKRYFVPLDEIKGQLEI